MIHILISSKYPLSNMAVLNLFLHNDLSYVQRGLQNVFNFNNKVDDFLPKRCKFVS